MKASTFVTHVLLISTALMPDSFMLYGPSSAHAAVDLTPQVANGIGWPRQFTSDGRQITIYQPQVEKWDGNQILERAAVSVQREAAAQPTFGVVWISARTEVDKEKNLVTLEDINFTHASFPSAPAQTGAYLTTLRNNAGNFIRPISLSLLRSSLAVTRDEALRKAPELKNTPPVIYYSSSPSVLLLIDGKPVLRDGGSENILRVINTRALVLLDQSSGTFFFYMGNRWMRSPSIEGPWTDAGILGAPLTNRLNTAKRLAVGQGQVDLLDDPQSSLMQEIAQGIVPKVFASTVPSELIETHGSPQFEPVANTSLLYVKNTEQDIFLDTTQQNYYVPISGRWYHAPSLQGPWAFVPPRSLPAEFAQIPENHPKGAVLASVPGTPEAKEAAISNDIPQTATIDRQQAGLAVNYDGDPQFRTIDGTPLQYAANSPIPVIEVDPHSFYSVKNGIWFVAATPHGPWTVATSVPEVIYTIPPSSPLYYVTYVYIYGSTPRVVYAGYLPGYLGSYVTPDGIVVYGTGYFYRPWIGAAWYGWPLTFGFGVTWGFGFGWAFHAGPAFHPWWGPWHGYRGAPYYGFTHANIYGGWGRSVVRSSSWARTQAFTGHSPNGGFARLGGLRSNNLYADHQGNVYRHSPETGWQRYGANGSWQNARPPENRNAGRSGELEEERMARSSSSPSSGAGTWRNYPPAGNSQSGIAGYSQRGSGKTRRRRR